jgi:Secretion system C-terminal sorting domain
MSLKVWPIPSQVDINVLLMGIEKDLLQVFDMSGRLVQQSPFLNNTQQKISGLNPGNYIIRLVGQNGLSQKIIIQ